MKSSHTGNDKTFNTLLQWILIMLLPLLYMIITGTLPTVNATSDDSVSCYERGIIDGENHPFNQRIYDNCRDQYSTIKVLLKDGCL